MWWWKCCWTVCKGRPLCSPQTFWVWSKTLALRFLLILRASSTALCASGNLEFCSGSLPQARLLLLTKFQPPLHGQSCLGLSLFHMSGFSTSTVVWKAEALKSSCSFLKCTNVCIQACVEKELHTNTLTQRSGRNKHEKQTGKGTVFLETTLRPVRA